MNSNQLPFEINIAAASKWLQSLNHLNSVNSADQLNKVVIQLKSIDIRPEEVLKILLLLTPTILSVCSTIEQSFLVESEKKAANKSRKIEKLCFQLLKHFISAISHIACTKTSLKKDQCLAIYMTLHIISFNQRLSAVLHLPPTPSIWKTIGELYSLAKENNILSLEVNHQIKEFHNQTSIECAIKHILLFSILSPYQCSTIQIKALFIFAQYHANLLDLNTKKTNGHCYFWDPQSKSQPFRDSEQDRSTSIIISTSELLSFIQSTNHSTFLEKQALAHAINQLSAYKELIDSALPSRLVINHIFIGLTETLEHLKKTSKLNKIQQLSLQFTEEKPKDAPLVSFEQNSSNYSNEENLLEKAKAVKIIQTKNDDFIVTEASNLDCHIGNIILRCKDDNSLELGIIRQQKTTNQSGTSHTLIERVIGTPSPLISSNPEITDKRILIVKNENSSPTIFLAPGKLSNGTKITPSSENSYILDQLIDYSQFYTHFSASLRDLS